MLSESLFIDDEVHERKVKLPDGQEHAMWFRQLPSSTFRKYQEAEQSPDENVRWMSMCSLVAASLCEPDGKPSLTVQRADRLLPGALNAIFLEVVALHSLSKAEKKALPPAETDGSGTS